MRLKRGLIWLSLAGLGLLMLAPPAQAAEGTNLEISPLPIELSVDPGGSVTTDLRVQNRQSHDVQLKVRLLRVKEDDNGNVKLENATPQDSYYNWVTFSQTNFNAPSNVWQTIKMTVSPPKTAAFGYYYAVEYYPANPTEAQGGQAAANGAVATFILLTVNAPGANRSAQIVSFYTDHRAFEFLPVTFHTKIRATGNLHVAPVGNIFISGPGENGQTAQMIVNQTQGNVLPQSSRIFDASWTDGFPHYETLVQNGQPVEKNGKVVRRLVWNWGQLSKLRVGRYTAKLIMAYNDGQRDVPLTASVSFWVFPWRLALVALVLLLIIIGGLYGNLRALRRRLRRR